MWVCSFVRTPLLSRRRTWRWRTTCSPPSGSCAARVAVWVADRSLPEPFLAPRSSWSGSTIVGQLTDADVLTRVADPRDRRVARLNLTTPVRERLERWRDQRASAAAGAIAELEPSERADLERAVLIIMRIAAAIGLAAEDPQGSQNQVRDE